jgi:hypothetical protein
MHADDAVVNLAATSQPLPGGAHGMAAALGSSRFIQAADRFGMSVLLSYQTLAVVAHTHLVPLDRFHETLYSAGRLAKLQSDGFDIFALQVRQQSLDIDLQQGETRTAPVAADEQCQKLGQLLAEAGNLLQRHPDGPPWYSFRESENTEDRLFLLNHAIPTSCARPTYVSFVQETGAVQLGKVV